jgi:hypothetical protein
MKTLATSLVLGVLVGASVLAAQKAYPIGARVFPPLAQAPSDVLVQAFIEPHARNRLVELVIDSDAFFSSSTVELDGEHAPRTKEVKFRRLPAGTYEVRVTLIGTDGARGTAVQHISLY